jgi:hypothetical protein
LDEFLMGFGRRMVPNGWEVERSLLEDGAISILLKVVHIFTCGLLNYCLVQSWLGSLDKLAWVLLITSLQYWIKRLGIIKNSTWYSKRAGCIHSNNFRQRIIISFTLFSTIMIESI